MKERKQLLDALRNLKVQTDSLACLGCGWEHNCSTQGCAILRHAIMDLQLSQVMCCQHCDYWVPNDPRCMNGKSQYGGRVMRPYETCMHCSVDLLVESEKARSDLGKRLAAALQRADRLLLDLKATQSCSPCVHADIMVDCEGECLACKLECPCRECRDSSNFKWKGDSDAQAPTNGDLFRQRTDEELVELLYQHYLSFSDRDGAEDPSVRWCDMKGACEGIEDYVCSPEQLKACILRWLKAKAEVTP